MISKKSFSLLELLFIIVIIAIVSLSFFPKRIKSDLNQAANKIIIHLKNTRHQAMIDNKFNHDDDFWFRERWTLKFQNCQKSIGGLYYVVYSDNNHGGHINKSETLKDSLTQKWLYSNYDCQASSNESKDILLTKKYGVTKVYMSCNNTNTIGQLSFGYEGQVYTKLGTKSHDTYKYLLKATCNISLFDKNNNKVTILIEPNTGYIRLK
ncbi:type II secretion system protein [Arcobacter sp. HD9-500m-PIT-SAG02]|nr:type II secretion system protein [Arcobacter sp. HD9-500m-PIT-SAG02]